jgi:enamine deaminase RidA (YjgF/YER057c/UK114 family)
MHRKIRPAGLRANPNYSHGIEVAPGNRFVAVAGQTGQRPDGSVPDGIAAQADLAWANVLTVLHAAGMGPEHIVHYTSYIVAGVDTSPYDEARMRHLGASRPASTKIIVAGLARPELLCEVQAFAAAPVGTGEPVV